MKMLLMKQLKVKSDSAAATGRHEKLAFLMQFSNPLLEAGLSIPKFSSLFTRCL
jgi:hypothetical protein